jgi:hypothetical protein
MDFAAELLEGFVPDCIEPRFGADFLADYRKRDAEIDPAEWQRYALDADIRLNGSNFGQRFRGKYFDTTFNFCLTHDGDLIASLGFDVDDEVMNVWQIQGVKGAQRWLRPLKWERGLLQYAVAWGRASALAAITVPSVNQVSWATQHAHLDPRRGKLLYDVTARRCGFHLGDDDYYTLALADAVKLPS